jgi:DNA-binding SARP family transcriptional activator
MLMPKPTLTFLGVPRFERAGVLLPFVQAKGVALLLYLAVTRTAQPRERLIDLLWPESLPQAARKNMRNTLWAIGEVLGSDLLEQVGGALRLAPDVVVDIHNLEAGLERLESGGVSELEQAVATYRGTLADGLVVHEAPEFELWLQRERERVTEVYLRLVERIIALHRSAGAWTPIMQHARRALAADPLREALHLALIEAYVQLGQRPQALQQYATLVEVLQRELGVPPLPATIARYERLLAVATVPVTRTGPAPLLESNTQVASPAKYIAPFVGRATEMATLEAERLRAAAGEARIIMITGDLGMGKTHLWHTWVETHVPTGIILTTHAIETSEPVPFAPLLTLFRQPGPAQALIRAPLPLAPIWLAELARLLPELALQWPNLPLLRMISPAEERARLLQALTEAFRLLTTPLLVLIIDDLHWVDPSTLDWLIYLVDQLKNAPLLLIGAYRPQDAPEQVAATVAGWQRQGRLRQLPLPHLTMAEAQLLLTQLGAPADTVAAAGWIQQSGGNPYFLTELQRAPDDAAQHDLTALVRARIHATVPATALPILQAAAILGDHATFPLLQATSGRSEEELLDVLDRLMQERVLTAENQRYHFIHPLVATVLRADLTPARRVFLHRRAAEALEQLHTPASLQVTGLLMEHFAAAGVVERAVPYADRAAEQASQVGAFVEAVSYTRQALAWAPTATRHLALGKALLFSGTATEAQEQLEAALHAFEQVGDLVGAARASLMLAMIAVSKSHFAQARQWLAHTALAQAEALNPALYAEASLLATTLERQNQEYATALTYLERAEQLVREHDLTPLAMQAAFERGNLLANHGEIEAAVAAFTEAHRLAERGNDLFGMAFAGNNLAYHTLLAGKADLAQQQIEAAITLTEQYKLTLLSQYVYSTAGEIALARQDLARAEEAFDQAYTAAQSRDNRIQMANVRASQALVAQARHQPAEAHALVEEAWSLFGETATDYHVRQRLERISKDISE